MSEPVYIVEIMEAIVAATSVVLLAQLQAVDPLITAVHYEYGHINDIRERITTFQKAGTNFCPLVCLIEDFGIDHGTVGITGVADMKIIIIYLSKKDITRRQRQANVFRPILYPVYKELLRQMKLNGSFSIYDVSKIKHRQINRPHWGDPGLYGNNAYLLNGIYDGIELTNLQLTIFLNNCL